MRMEAKNSYFKKVSQLGNLKNLPFSIASRHQKLMSGYLQGALFNYWDLNTGPCMLPFINNYYDCIII